MNSFTLPSFAKLNLGLQIKGRREDGYHEISTVFQTISLRDNLTFEEKSGPDLVLKCNDPSIPVDERNLVLRAASALKRQFGVSAGAEIRLEKVIPAGGGLGGGSSNAAITLIGLCRLWNIRPEPGQLAEIGAGLGADVCFFLSGGTAVGTGVGDKIQSVPDVDLPFLLIATPDVHISTAEAYKMLNSPALTKETGNIILSVSDTEAQMGISLSSELRNDFESVVFEIEPEVRRARSRMCELGARVSLLSGSGSSVFGLFDSRETRADAFRELEKESGWRVFACSSISRAVYAFAMGECARFLNLIPHFDIGA